MASGLHCETPDSCGEGKRERGVADGRSMMKQVGAVGRRRG
jgi:hypothetical protein